MTQTPDYEEFKALIKRVDDQQEQIEFLKSLLVTQMWLSREGTARALDISDTTLWRLTKAGKLTYRYQGKKILYDIESLRIYLLAQKIESKYVEQRILAARVTHESGYQDMKKPAKQGV